MAATAATRQRLTPAARKEAFAFHLFTAPWAIGFLAFTLIPMAVSLFLSFTEYNISKPPMWVGLRQYEKAFFEDAAFWVSLKVTFTYATTSVPLHLIVGLVIALLLNSDIPAVSVWRTLYYLPSVLSGVAVAVLWMLVFHPTQGVLNTVLGYFGIQGPQWLFDKDWALSALVIMSMWGVGGSMIIYLSSLQGIPTTLYEAATIDGATAWRKFWSITLPMITPVLFFNLVMGIIGSLQSFTNAFVMTEGGPQNATLFYGLRLYYAAFRDVRMGYASMLAWVLFVIILALTGTIVKSSSFWVYYEGGARN
jgi:multiple sugar transport system permease protein